MSIDLNPATIAALSNLLADAAKTSREELGNGTGYDVNETVVLHVEARVNVSEDETRPIVAKADPWLLLAVALSHLNGQTVESITREALTADPELVKSLKKQAATAIAKVKAPTMTYCMGRVTIPKSKASLTVVASQAEAV